MTVERLDAVQRVVRGRLRGGGEGSITDHAFASGEVRLVERAPEHPEHHVVVAGSPRQAYLYARKRGLDPRHTRIATRPSDLVGISWRGLTIHLASTDLPEEMHHRIGLLVQQGAMVVQPGVRG